MSSTPRVLVAAIADARAGDVVLAPGDVADHVLRVLRLQAGARLVVFDGLGREANAQIAESESVRRSRTLRIRLLESPREGVRHDTASVILIQGMPKGEKLAAIVRDATELGVREVWPVFTARSVARVGTGAANRTERLRAVASAAASQCGRADVPTVRDAAALDEALARLPADLSTRLCAWEESQQPFARLLLDTPRATSGLALLVGPEGGLDGADIERAEAAGFRTFSLGRRVLRTETVAAAALAILSFERGDLAGIPAFRR